MIAIAGIAGLWLLRPGGLYFLNDDFIHIPLSASAILIQHHLWRPVCNLSIMLDYQIWGKQAWGYHLMNILLHLFNTFLVWILAGRIQQQFIDTRNAAIFRATAAVLFFVYAYHSETLFWILGRSASLGAAFALPALIFFLDRNKGKWKFVLSLISFQAGLLTYESIWIFPVLTAVFSFYTIRKNKHSSSQQELWMNGMVWLVFAANLFVKYLFIGAIYGQYEAGSLHHFSFITLLSGGAKLFLRTFLPPMQHAALFSLCGVIVVVLAIAAFLAAKSKKEANIFGLLFLCLLITYVPCLSLSVDTHGVESERYLYLPSVFAAILITYVFMNLPGKYFYLPITILISFHLFFLYRSRQNYLLASHITRSTYQQINLLSHKKRLFIDSLPEEVNGALVFRLGFKEGLQWLKQPETVDSVYVLSHKQADAKREMADELNDWTIISYTSDSIQPLQKNGWASGSLFKNAPTYNPVTDAYMIFKNGRWLIYK